MAMMIDVPIDTYRKYEHGAYSPKQRVTGILLALAAQEETEAA